MRAMAMRDEEFGKKRNDFSRIRRALGHVGTNHEDQCEITWCLIAGHRHATGHLGKEENTYIRLEISKRTTKSSGTSHMLENSKIMKFQSVL